MEALVGKLYFFSTSYYVNHVLHTENFIFQKWWCCGLGGVAGRPVWKAWLLELCQWEEVGTSMGCVDTLVTGGVPCGRGLGDSALSLSRHSQLCQRSCSAPPRVFTSSQAQRNMASWHRPKPQKRWLKMNSLQVDYLGCFVVVRETSRQIGNTR